MLTTLFFVLLSFSCTIKKYMEFPGWTDQESINAYVSRVRSCLLDDESKRVFDERVPQDALAMLFDKFVGRFRPATVAIVCTVCTN